jgi:hypothetical protein
VKQVKGRSISKSSSVEKSKEAQSLLIRTMIDSFDKLIASKLLHQKIKLAVT